jgi:hypothetical protein
MAMPYMNVLYDWRADIRSLWFYHSVRYKNGNTVDLVFPFYMYIIKNYKSPRRRFTISIISVVIGFEVPNESLKLHTL